MTCPECRAEVKRLMQCDCCFVGCYECSLKTGPSCIHPTDEWLVGIKITKDKSGRALRQPRFVQVRTHVSPNGHNWRPFE